MDGVPENRCQAQTLDCCRIHQDGDDGELTVLFDLADFDKIAEVMRPHRKRQWTEDQKRQARERLAKYQDILPGFIDMGEGSSLPYGRRTACDQSGKLAVCRLPPSSYSIVSDFLAPIAGSPK
jgi:hypothetical protein